LELVIEQAGMILPRFVDNNTQFPIQNIVNTIGFNNCKALINEEVIAYFRCPETLAPISDPVLLGIVNLFPDDRLYAPTSIIQGGCGEIPSFEFDCGELEVLSYIPPSSDCNNLTVGEFVWTVDPGFDSSDAPGCFELPGGEFVLLPCSENCHCEETILCGSTPVSLSASFSNIPNNICSDELFDLQVFLLGTGVSQANITIQIFDSTGGEIADVNLLQGTTSTSIFLDFTNTSCLPIEKSFTYRVLCTGGSILDEGILGPINIYPAASSYLPFIIEGNACGINSFIESAPCGTLNLFPNQIPNPQCGLNAQDQTVQWNVDLGIEIPEEISYCFDLDDFSGELIIPACELSEGDDCFDDCLGPGTIDADCKCQFSNPPILIPDRDITGNYCAFGGVGLDFDIVGYVPPNGLAVIVIDQTNKEVGFGSVDFFDLTSGSLNVEFFNNSCEIEVMELSYYFACGDRIIGEIIPLATVQVYPFQFNYVVDFFNYNSCADIPEIFTVCGDLVITDIVEPVHGTNPIDGFIEYTLDPGIDISGAPQCFSFDPNLSGTFLLPACVGCGSHGNLTIRAVEQGN